MSASGMLDNFKQSAAAFWIERDARERTLIGWMGLVIAAGAIYAALLDPALRGRAQLEKNLPGLRQQAVQLQDLSKQAAVLANAGAPPVAVLSRETLDAVLARKGLKPQSVSLSDDVTRIQFSSASFAAILDWLDEMQKTARLSVTDANIVALGQPDTVNATLTLRQQKARDE